MNKSKVVQDFILNVIQQSVSRRGWVSFHWLMVIDPNLHDDFYAYCQKHGCTLTGKPSETLAPWTDFRAFILGESPDD